MPDTSTKRSGLRAFASANYRLFFIGQGISLIGTWITQTASIWLVYHLTGSALWLGIVGFASQLPNFLLLPIAGVFVDRWNRHQTLVLTQILALIQSLILAILVLSGHIQVWHLIVLGIMQGIVNGFDMPARQAFMVEILEHKDDLGNAIALNSSLFSGARLIGPAIAGIMIAAVGAGWCFLIDAISYLAVIASLFLMRFQPVAASLTPAPLPFWQTFRQGFRYAFGFTPIRSILLLIALVSLVGMPYIVLIPVFAQDILKGGPQTLGFLMAASGFGAMVAAIYLSARPSVLGLGKFIAIAPAIFGAALILFAQSHVLGLSLIAMLGLGASLIFLATSSNTVLQTIVQSDKRGQVMSFYVMAFIGMSTFGNLIAGSVASAIGASQTLEIGGILCILGSVLFFRQLPRIRKLVRPIYTEIGLLAQQS